MEVAKLKSLLSVTSISQKNNYWPGIRYYFHFAWEINILHKLRKGMSHCRLYSTWLHIDRTYNSSPLGLQNFSLTLLSWNSNKASVISVKVVLSSSVDSYNQFWNLPADPSFPKMKFKNLCFLVIQIHTNVNCIDTTLHNILIRYSLSVAKYLLYVSRPEQSGEALELVHSVCQCAEKKMVMCVQRLEMILCGCACSAPSEGILKETKKKGKAKSAKVNVL